MVKRTKLLVVLSFFAVGCGYQRQTGFQNSFLPAAKPFVPPAAVTAEPPAVQNNPYISEAPKFITEKRVPMPPRPSAGDALIRDADQRFQQGKKHYQAKETEVARAEFDAAIDLMFEASANSPSDPTGFESKLEDMVEVIHRFDLAGLGNSRPADEPADFEKAPLEDILEMTFPVDPKLKVRVKEQLQATVSQLPLAVNDSVLGYIHYFSGRGRKTMLAGLRRAGRYRPLIQRILDEEGLPQELIHLAQAESGFLPRAVSRKAATGMWQFMAFRGREYGLLRTPHFDDRLDPEKATRAAARHLRDLYHQFGDWYLAIAAYNCGPGTVEKAVERTGYADFFELRRRRVLPAETTNYVPIILAMTIMVKNAEEYGLQGVDPDPALEYDNVEITSPTHLALTADLTGAPVSELTALNPALLRGVAPKGYVLHVPKGSAEPLVAALQLVPEERRASWRMHKVESGDTLATIGKRYGAAPSTIAAANQIASGAPVEGDRLVIPAVAKAYNPVVQRAKYSRATAKRTTAAKRTSTKRASVGHTVSAKGVPAKSTNTRAATVARQPRRGPVVLARTASAARTSKVKAAWNR